MVCQTALIATVSLLLIVTHAAAHPTDIAPRDPATSISIADGDAAAAALNPTAGMEAYSVRRLKAPQWTNVPASLLSSAPMLSSTSTDTDTKTVTNTRATITTTSNAAPAPALAEPIASSSAPLSTMSFFSIPATQSKSPTSAVAYIRTIEEASTGLTVETIPRPAVAPATLAPLATLAPTENISTTTPTSTSEIPTSTPSTVPIGPTTSVGQISEPLATSSTETNSLVPSPTIPPPLPPRRLALAKRWESEPSPLKCEDPMTRGDDDDECPDNAYWDKTLGKCKCDAGFKWSESAFACQPIGHFDRRALPVSCPDHGIWNATNGRCVCEAGYHWNGRACVEATWETAPAASPTTIGVHRPTAAGLFPARIHRRWSKSKCPINANWDEHVKECVCDTGFKWSAMSCNAIVTAYQAGVATPAAAVAPGILKHSSEIQPVSPTSKTKCPDNAIWNEFDGECICDSGFKWSGKSCAAVTTLYGQTGVTTPTAAVAPGLLRHATATKPASATTTVAHNHAKITPASLDKRWSKTKCPDNSSWDNYGSACVCDTGFKWSGKSCNVVSTADSQAGGASPAAAVAPGLLKHASATAAATSTVSPPAPHKTVPQAGPARLGRRWTKVECPKNAYWDHYEDECVCDTGFEWTGKCCERAITYYGSPTPVPIGAPSPAPAAAVAGGQPLRTTGAIFRSTSPPPRPAHLVETTATTIATTPAPVGAPAAAVSGSQPPLTTDAAPRSTFPLPRPAHLIETAAATVSNIVLASFGPPAAAITSFHQLPGSGATPGSTIPPPGPARLVKRRTGCPPNGYYNIDTRACACDTGYIWTGRICKLVDVTAVTATVLAEYSSSTALFFSHRPLHTVGPISPVRLFKIHRRQTFDPVRTATALEPYTTTTAPTTTTTTPSSTIANTATTTTTSTTTTATITPTSITTTTTTTPTTHHNRTATATPHHNHTITTTPHISRIKPATPQRTRNTSGTPHINRTKTATPHNNRTTTMTPHHNGTTTATTKTTTTTTVITITTSTTTTTNNPTTTATPTTTTTTATPNSPDSTTEDITPVSTVPQTLTLTLIVATETIEAASVITVATTNITTIMTATTTTTTIPTTTETPTTTTTVTSTSDNSITEELTLVSTASQNLDVATETTTTTVIPITISTTTTTDSPTTTATPTTTTTTVTPTSLDSTTEDITPMSTAPQTLTLTLIVATKTTEAASVRAVATTNITTIITATTTTTTIPTTIETPTTTTTVTSTSDNSITEESTLVSTVSQTLDIAAEMTTTTVIEITTSTTTTTDNSTTTAIPTTTTTTVTPTSPDSTTGDITLMSTTAVTTETTEAASEIAVATTNITSITTATTTTTTIPTTTETSNTNTSADSITEEITPVSTASQTLDVETETTEAASATMVASKRSLGGHAPAQLEVENPDLTR
ncbi:hypothetical protein BDK51DRAFT_43219 [Blyttiomyces helicus]|uniref:EGF-like domain-containing protein n=1 Tax=Blyttiomyces helicus TaxID=388810 RepID=A0A4P9WMM4_9FUNG|nr:hypothetical protein BDK51DRAFT_43219 [Blyttiomyces helicus]|eukprot:RKO92430.1 hypothetical protein BDK51DRAFT_43219 [Blyttiomyces helicus]